MKRITQFILCLVLAVSAYGQGVGGNSVPRTVSGISNALDLISSTQGTVFYRGASGWEALTPGTSGQLLSTQGAAANPIWVTATGGAGDINGPASATDNAIVRFDGTGGKTVQNSAVTIADTTGAMTWATGQAATLTGGDSGASLVAGALSAGNASVTITPKGSGGLVVTSASTANNQNLLSLLQPSYVGNSNAYLSVGVANATNNTGVLQFNYNGGSGSASNYLSLGLYGQQGIVVTGNSNLLINTLTDMASTSGGLTVAATGSGATATGVNTGGLRSANFGLSTVSGGASYFGGALFSSSYIRTTGTYGFQIGELSGHQRIIYGNIADTFQFLTAENGAASLSAGSASLSSTTPSTGVGTGALQVEGGIYAGAASVFAGLVSVGGSTPASASAAGAAGTVTWDANYIYICTKTNTWKRVAIATW